MKTTNLKITLLSLFLLFGSLNLFAQNKLSAAQWHEDLSYLQDLVHKDYNFLFKKVSQEQWDAAVNQLQAQIPTMTDHEVMVGIKRIVALFAYGHTNLVFHNSKIPYHKLPLNFYWFNDGVYIEGTQIEYQKALGAKVLKIGDTPIDKALDLVRKSVSVENEQFFKAYGIPYLAIPEVLHAQGVLSDYSKDVTLTLLKDGQEFTHTFTAVDPSVVEDMYSYSKQEGEWLSARKQDKTPLFLKDLDKIYYYEYLPESKTVYVRQSQVQNDPSESIEDFYERVFKFIENNDVERFVLDVRLNGGGNNYLNLPIITGVIKSKINKVGSFYTLIGRRTFSACQNMINELDRYTNVIFVGEPSSENLNFYGDNRKHVLPNSGLSAYLSWAWWQDYSQWENEDWMAPNIFVDTSFDQYVNNQDPVLDAALGFSADSDLVLDPMQYLTELFMAGEYAKVESEAARLVKDPMHQFTDFEALFLQAGSNLMNSGQVQGAALVYNMTAELFPNSTESWYGLALAVLESEDLQQAKKLFEKVSQMEPYGPLGEKARAKLKTLE